MSQEHHTMTQDQFGEPWEIQERSGREDSKGREIGFIRGHREVLATGECYAWVQAARRGKDRMFHEFGVPQRSKCFKNKELAQAWTKQVAQERISKLKS